ncbi:MAG: Phosphatespecific outer rane porin OprP Pyrophosphatespecific outer rane porin OprO [Rhodospirillales bacterium]|nr:Phosphatespecific outer rane porin OprP Pyrophosphatespecific outer rane porin OprO [Rhodospirillales bacterium]
MTVRALLLAGTVAGAAIGIAHIASAQTAQELAQTQQAQIDYLKRQLGIFAAQLQQIEAQQAGATKPGAKPAPKVTQSASNKFAIESADGQYSMGLTGGFQGDVGYYPGFEAKSKVVGPQNLNSGFNARRARIGVTGRAGGDFTYTFIYDAGNSSDATPKGIETAQVNYVGIKGLSVDFGYSNTPFTLDQATSSYDTLFMERATPSNIATALNTGDNRSNFGAKYFTDRYWIGAYVTGPAVGDAHGVAERIGAFQRATYQVLQDPNYTLHVGVAADELLKAPNTGPNTANAISLSDQPELRVDTTTFANTGTLGTVANPVTGAQIYDFELAGNYQNFFFQGEYFHYDIERRGLKTAEFDGAYGQAAWTITGESHKYVPSSGSYARIVPDHAFSPKDGYWGAWEVAGRVSYVDLTSNFTAGLPISATSQPSAIVGGRQTSYTVGLNWYPNSYLRFELDYLHTDFDKANPTALPGVRLGAPVGAEINALALRTQVTW